MTRTHTLQWLLPCLFMSLIACQAAPVRADSGASGGVGSDYSDAPRPAPMPSGVGEVRRLYQRGDLTATEICHAVAVVRARQRAHPKAVERAEALLKEQHIDCPPVPDKP